MDFIQEVVPEESTTAVGKVDDLVAEENARNAPLKDSGARREFESGAVRDIQVGKGRCDLLPLDTISYIINDNILFIISEFLQTKDPACLSKIVSDYCLRTYGNFMTGILEVAIHYEQGAEKYAPHNWEKGIPLHYFIDSGVRHYLKFLRGDKDEPHDRAFVWNMLGAMWTLKHRPELDDI